MGKRIDLHNKLINLLGNNNVYYQPPENLKMEYPCIRYSRSRINSFKANNKNYLNYNRYDVIVIDKRPDNTVIDKILAEFPMSSFDRHYIADNLNHDAFSIYY